MFEHFYVLKGAFAVPHVQEYTLNVFAIKNMEIYFMIFHCGFL